MAAILDPKTRFFDMYITSEGRRQMSNGELRMRFVSFSDGYTSYEESEPGVIDRKDGEIFFEAMSRPQDSLISENPSIVNMLEIRKPGAQPAFLSNTIQVPADNDGIDNDGVEGIDQPGEMRTVTLSNASIFGEEIFVPPTGYVTQSISTAGIDTAEINYDPTKSFYISGSDTQELYYDCKSNGIKGSWVFDRSVGQPATGISGEPSNFLTVLDKVSQNLSSSSYFGTNASYMEYSNNQHQNDSSPNLSTEVVLKNIAIDELNSKSYSSSTNTYIRISIDEYMYGRIPALDNSGRNIVKRPSQFHEEFVDPEAERVLRNSNLGYLEIDDWDQEREDSLELKYSDFPHPGASAHGSYRWVNQFSVWFYIKESAFDSGNTQTIATFYANAYNSVDSESQTRARIFTIRNQLFLSVYDKDGNIINTDGNSTGADNTLSYGVANSSGPIEPNKWHRVSFVYGTPLNPGQPLTAKSYAYLVLDGKMKNAASNRQEIQTTSNIMNISTVILGNYLTNADGTPGSLSSSPSGQFLDGYIQSCEYYAQPAKLIEEGTNISRTPGSISTITIPAFGLDSIFTEYNNYNSSLDANLLNFTGLSNEVDENGDNIYDRLTRLGGEVVKINDQAVSAVEASRRWVDYIPISAEGALYWAGFSGKSYVRESQLDRGMRKAKLDEIVELAENAMSGTLKAYNELKLLCHKDSSNSNNRDFSIDRYAAQMDNGKLKRLRPPLPSGETRFFNTRMEEYPDREPVYGQSPDMYYRNAELRNSNLATVGQDFESKITGKVFLKEATVYHLEEVIDNEVDNDDTTVSSSRVPNFLFLPPIGASYFKFEGIDLEDGEETIENVMTFRNFLKRRASGVSATLDTVRELGQLGLTTDQNLSSTLNTYKNLMRDYYLNLIPEDFTNSLLKTLYMDGGPDGNFSDSNEEIIKYVLRNTNNKSLYSNNNQFNLHEFSEIIDFTNTSEFNNSFIQMFEVSNDEGKSKFSKLAIKDLGIIKKSAVDFSLSGGSNVALERYDNELAQDAGFSTNGGTDHLQDIYSHVFVFGKIINKNENSPGTSIYFTPIFSLELEIGGENGS